MMSRTPNVSSATPQPVAHPVSPDIEDSREFDLGYLWRISLIAAMGGFLFGYDWVVIGGAKPFFEAYFSLTSEMSRGWANSCAVVGCLAGSVISGALSDRDRTSVV